ncbi:response regulator [Streptomyces sp. NPDC058682]|uniref:response regulator n=1 Tax=unclassified Streptomyces TaxID=2593676 RepID=UPI00224C9C18|nr:response regulator transcription factor [Streptomyces sp. NBC_01214]MCX4804248.1 response regulator transcription factor [Streptomyces sp. NBC_01214]
MVRVMVVDDEALVRSGLTMILNAAADIEVVAATGGGQALAAVAAYAPDLVLLDIRMPDVDGLTVLARLMELPDPPVVAMLTTFDSDQYVSTALRSGASGFLVKDTDPDELAHQVRSLAAGAMALAPQVTATVISGYLHHRGEQRALTHAASRLSARERDILVLLSQGLSNADIGRRLHLSIGTVKDYVSAVLTKLDVSNRVQAALWAERAGLLDGTHA